MTNEEQVAEEVFKQTFIPQKMDEVINYQKDARRAQSGESVEYLCFLGLKGDLSVSAKPEILAENGGEEEAGEDDSGEEEEEEAGGECACEEDGGGQKGRDVNMKSKDGVKEEERTQASKREKGEGRETNGPNDASDSDDNDDEEEEEDEDEEKESMGGKKSVERRDLSPESWKRHKKELKLERREKLKDKLPKHIKKRKEKLGKERKGKK